MTMASGFHSNTPGEFSSSSNRSAGRNDRHASRLYPRYTDNGPHSGSLPGHETEISNRAIRVLLAEDNEADAYLVRQALLGMQAEVILRKDGEQMVRTIDQIDAGTLACPDIVLLDLNLPRYNGIQVLEHLRASAACGSVPVIIVTSSDAARDRDLAAVRGVSGYFRKPPDFDEFMLLGDLVRQVIAKT